MRTLKKTLALVLVLVMMFSLCVTASAADFTDVEEIENAKAVSTLVGLGVIDGMPDGSFAPEGTLTRAQAAKIIACLLGVGEYAADPAETGFADVPASHWASGYIAFCADAGIVSGYGDGNFGPSDVLTGYQWSKMLLCALGYDAAAEGYTGSAWQIAVSKAAVNLKLWAGADADNTVALTRDDACQYAYNTLNQEAVKAYYFLGQFSGYETLGLFANYNLGVEVYNYTASDMYGRPVDTVESFDLADLKYDDVNDEYYVDEEDIDVLYAEPIAAVLTYTAGVTAAKIKTDLGYTTKTADKCVLEGELDTVNGEGLGTLVEVYATATKDTYYVNVIDEAVVVIAEDDIDEEKGTVEVAGVDVETTALKAGDVVVYTLSDDTAELEYYVATATTGTVTSVSSKGFFYLDGAAMNYAAGKGDVSVIETGAEDVTVYTDKYGYVVYAQILEEKEEEEKVTVYYGYVTDYAQKEGSAATLLAPAVAPVEKVELVNAEGETVLLDCAYKTDKDGKFVSFLTSADVKDNLVSYTLDKDGKVATIKVAKTASKDYTFETGKATLDNGSTNRFTSKTLAFVVGKDGVKVYTGYQAIPGFTAAFQQVVVSNTYAAIAIPESALTKAPDVIEKDYVFVASAAYETASVKGADGKAVTVYNYTDLYVDGVQTTLTFAEVQEDLEAGLYNYEVNATTGYATIGEAVDTIDSVISVVEATYVKAGTIYYVAEGTVYYAINIAEDETISVAAAETLPELPGEKDEFAVVMMYAYDGADKDTAMDVVYFMVVDTSDLK